MRKIIFGALLILSTVFSVRSQNLLLGTVTHETDGSIIEGVTIYFPELNTGTTSDELGKYRLENLPSGTFTVKFLHIGFATQVISAKIETGENTLNVQLLPAAIEADEIIIYGTKASSSGETPLV